MSLTHQDVQNQIQSGRKLTAGEQAALSEHLAACPECRAYATFHEQLSQTLPQVYPARRHSAQELRTKAQTVGGKLVRRRRMNQFFHSAVSLAGVGAAVLLLLVGLGLLPGLISGELPSGSNPQPAAQVLQAAQPMLTEVAAVLPTATAEPDPFRITYRTPAAVLPTTTGEVTASPTPPARWKIAFVPALAVDGQTVYTGAGPRLAAVDISRPAAPLLLAQSEELPGEVVKVLKIPGEPAARIAVSAGRYLAVFDPSTPGHMGLITQSKLPGPVTALILDIGANRIYAGGMLNSDANRGFIAALDASQPEVLNLLDTIELPAPVQSLALSRAVLYAALTGDAPEVMALPVINDQLGEPVRAILNLPVTSMTAVREVLYLGSTGRMLAYDLADPLQPRMAWQIDNVGDTPLPQTILGFELRANLIYIAGEDASGQPLRMVVPLDEPIQTGSMVDTASHIAVTGGMMLAAGDLSDGKPLEIYDVLNPVSPKLLGTYKP